MSRGMIDVDVDDDVVEIVSGLSGWAVANKEHGCDECHHKIPKGERFHIDTFLHGGSPFRISLITCKHCMGIRALLGPIRFGAMIFAFWDLLLDSDGEAPWDLIADLPEDVKPLIFAYIELIWTHLEEYEA